MFTRPTVVGENVFVGSCSGVFYAIDRVLGVPVWSYDTRDDAGPAQFHGDPVAVGDLIVTGSDTAEPSFAYAFDRKTGVLVWKISFDAPETDLLLVNGLLIGRSWTGDLLALDPETGDVHWKVPGRGSRCQSRVRAAAFGDDALVFVDQDGMARAVSPQSGEKIWSVQLGCAAGAPVLDGGFAYVGLADYRLVKITTEDGAIVAERELQGVPHSNLALAGDVVIAIVDEATLVAVSNDLSRMVWQRTTRGGVWSSFRPLVWRDRVIAGDSDGKLFAIDVKSGAVAWTVTLPNTIRGLGADDGAIYVGTLGGVVLAIRPPE